MILDKIVGKEDATSNLDKGLGADAADVQPIAMTIRDEDAEMVTMLYDFLTTKVAKVIPEPEMKTSDGGKLPLDIKQANVADAIIEGMAACGGGVCLAMGSVWMWGGKAWVYMGESGDKSEEMVYAVLECISVSHLIPHSMRTPRNARAIAQRITDVAARLRMAKPISAVNVANGTLVLGLDGSPTLHPHSSTIFVNYIHPWEWKPKTVATEWIAWLEETIHEEDVRVSLQMWLGYLLAPMLVKGGNIQGVAFFMGGKQTGKSTIRDVMRKMWGGQISGLTLDTLSSDPYTRDMMTGKMVNWGDEIGDTKAAVGYFKTVSSSAGRGVKEPTRGMHKTGMAAIPPLAFNGNVMPRGFDDAAWRRVLLYEFKHYVPMDKIRRDLPEVLAREAVGILNWMIDGLKMAIAAGGNLECVTMTEARDRWRGASNSALLFMTEFYVKCAAGGGDHSGKTAGSVSSLLAIGRKELYVEYQEWASGNGFRPFSSSRFGEELRDAGYIYKLVSQAGTKARVWFVAKVDGLVDQGDGEDGDGTDGGTGGDGTGAKVLPINVEIIETASGAGYVDGAELDMAEAEKAGRKKKKKKRRK